MGLQGTPSSALSALPPLLWPLQRNRNYTGRATKVWEVFCFVFPKGKKMTEAMEAPCYIFLLSVHFSLSFGISLLMMPEVFHVSQAAHGGPPSPMDTRTSQISRALLPCNSSSLSPSQGESTPARAPCLQWNKYSTAPAACLGAVIPGSFPTTPTGAFLAFLAPHTRAPQRIMLLLVQAMIPSFWVSRTAILLGRREF